MPIQLIQRLFRVRNTQTHEPWRNVWKNKKKPFEHRFKSMICKKRVIHPPKRSKTKLSSWTVFICECHLIEEICRKIHFVHVIRGVFHRHAFSFMTEKFTVWKKKKDSIVKIAGLLTLFFYSLRSFSIYNGNCRIPCYEIIYFLLCDGENQQIPSKMTGLAVELFGLLTHFIGWAQADPKVVKPGQPHRLDMENHWKTYWN